MFMISPGDYDRFKKNQNDAENFNQKMINSKFQNKKDNSYHDSYDSKPYPKPIANPINHENLKTSDTKVRHLDSKLFNEKLKNEYEERELYSKLKEKLAPIFSSSAFSTTQENKHKVTSILILLKELPYVVVQNDKFLMVFLFPSIY